jgi:hypothetical protein
MCHFINFIACSKMYLQNCIIKIVGNYADAILAVPDGKVVPVHALKA